MDAVPAESVHPYKRWVLVKADQRLKKTAGGIVLPDQLVGVERVMEGTGVVLSVGSEVDEVAIKDRVVYRGFLKDVSRGMVEPIDGCEVFLIRVEDLMAVIGDDVTMGAFSAPSAA